MDINAPTLESTLPRTTEKNATDAKDIEYMIFWLAENDLNIGFEEYAGKTKDELIPLVRKYRKTDGSVKAALGDGWDLL